MVVTMFGKNCVTYVRRVFKEFDEFDKFDRFDARSRTTFYLVFNDS